MVDRRHDGPDVLIVGGGIGGTVLSLALGLRKRSVVLLERDTVPPRTLRPEVLAESTFASLDPLGLGARLRHDASLALTGIQLRRGERVLVRVDERDLAQARVAPRSVDPALVRSIALERALATGCVELRRGAEVRELVRDQDRVVGVRGLRDGSPFETFGRLVVGDDGARSIVREALGTTIDLRRFPLDFVTARIERPPELPASEARVWIPSGRIGGGLAAAGCLPLPGGTEMIVLPIPADSWDGYATSAERFWLELTTLTPLAPALRASAGFPSAFGRFRLTYGHAARYTADGVALIGDAAHPMSPAGGQGANAAIADGLVLAEVADAALAENDLSSRRLAEFDRRRRAANARSLSFTERAVDAIGWLRRIPASGTIVAALLEFAGNRSRLKQRVLRVVATAFLEQPADRSA